MANSKLYNGKPNLEPGWDAVGLTCEVDGTRWFASIKETDSDKKIWQSVKVTAYDKPVKSKANYWTGWNGERFGNSRDLQTMKKHRPELYDAIIELFDRAGLVVAETDSDAEAVI